MVIEEPLVGGVRKGAGGAITYRGVNWWPTPGGSDLQQDVPVDIAEAYAEALRCISANAPHGATAVLRTVMTLIADDKGSESVRRAHDLKDKIAAMVSEGVVPASLGEWATHVRLYGNAGAHPDLFGNVSVEEARDAARLAHTFADVLYVLPATIARRQAERPGPRPRS